MNSYQPGDRVLVEATLSSTGPDRDGDVLVMIDDQIIAAWRNGGDQ